MKKTKNQCITTSDKINTLRTLNNTEMKSMKGGASSFVGIIDDIA